MVSRISLLISSRIMCRCDRCSLLSFFRVMEISIMELLKSRKLMLLKWFGIGLCRFGISFIVIR